MKMCWIHGFHRDYGRFPHSLPENNVEVKRYYPGDVLVTGFDIIFFWVARMMMMSMHFMDGEVPFKEVYIHALVRDEKARKCLNQRAMFWTRWN